MRNNDLLGQAICLSFNVKEGIERHTQQVCELTAIGACMIEAHQAWHVVVVQ